VPSSAMVCISKCRQLNFSALEPGHSVSTAKRTVLSAARMFCIFVARSTGKRAVIGKAFRVGFAVRAAASRGAKSLSLASNSGARNATFVLNSSICARSSLCACWNIWLPNCVLLVMRSSSVAKRTAVTPAAVITNRNISATIKVAPFCVIGCECELFILTPLVGILELNCGGKYLSAALVIV
jgi:hypothetical protein